MDLNEASETAFRIAVNRKQYENDGLDTVRCLKHCAGEVIEAVDAYNNWGNNDLSTKEDFENELADIIICILSVSKLECIDIEKAIARKMLINEGRVKNGCN